MTSEVIVFVLGIWLRGLIARRLAILVASQNEHIDR